MAVQILNDMPDAAVHRGDREPSLSDWRPRATRAGSAGKRPLFIAITLGVHAVAALGFLSIRHIAKSEAAPPMMATLIEEVRSAEQAPPVPPPTTEVVYTLQAPEQISFETEAVSAPTVAAVAISSPTPQAVAVAAPFVESVEYLRAPAPVYPRESNRRHERGTVILRVLVDPSGRPAQIEIERSSGYDRLDVAAREAVQKAMFRPYEVNGVRQAAQVLIPIEFTRRDT
jgi:protein TonB